MSRFLSGCLVMVGVVGVMSSVYAQAGKTDAQSFLEKAAEGQQIEISLGQLATQRAQSERVKEFGAQMAEDHKKASNKSRNWP